MDVKTLGKIPLPHVGNILVKKQEFDNPSFPLQNHEFSYSTRDKDF